jgi:hypothetical protein
MATTTTNYGFDIPQSTDLVKDGATAIATLGQDIDTAMNTALGTKKAGMVLLNTTSFSAVASQSVNSVFSSTYDNYKIIFVGSASATISINFRLRVAGVDASGSNYIRQRITASSTTVAGARATGTSYFPGDVEFDPSMQIIELANPAKASKTGFMSQGSQLVTSGGAQTDLIVTSGQHDLSTAYDGFSIIASSGTITGTVSVYGYNK